MGALYIFDVQKESKQQFTDKDDYLVITVDKKKDLLKFEDKYGNISEHKLSQTTTGEKISFAFLVWYETTEFTVQIIG